MYLAVVKVELGKPRQPSMLCSTWLLLVVAMTVWSIESFKLIVFFKHLGMQKHPGITTPVDL
jgi:hypothetical protein